MSANQDLLSSLVPLRLLGNKNAAELWPLVNVIMITWVTLVIAPRWKHTKRITLIGPFLHAIIYTGTILSLVIFSEDQTAADFSTLQGVVDIFKDPNGVFAGWIHYVVFDALVARMIVFDSIKRGASVMQHIFLVIPCLFFTFLTGPMGWLMYQGLSFAFFSASSSASQHAGKLA